MNLLNGNKYGEPTVEGVMSVGVVNKLQAKELVDVIQASRAYTEIEGIYWEDSTGQVIVKLQLLAEFKREVELKNALRGMGKRIKIMFVQDVAYITNNKHLVSVSM